METTQLGKSGESQHFSKVLNLPDECVHRVPPGSTSPTSPPHVCPVCGPKGRAIGVSEPAVLAAEQEAWHARVLASRYLSALRCGLIDVGLDPETAPQYQEILELDKLYAGPTHYRFVCEVHHGPCRLCCNGPADDDGGHNCRTKLSPAANALREKQLWTAYHFMQKVRAIRRHILALQAIQAIQPACATATQQTPPPPPPNLNDQSPAFDISAPEPHAKAIADLIVENAKLTSSLQLANDTIDALATYPAPESAPPDAQRLSDIEALVDRINALSRSIEEIRKAVEVIEERAAHQHLYFGKEVVTVEVSGVIEQAALLGVERHAYPGRTDMDVAVVEWLTENSPNVKKGRIGIARLDRVTRKAGQAGSADPLAR